MSITSERIDELALEVADITDCPLEFREGIEQAYKTYARALLAAVEAEMVPVGIYGGQGIITWSGKYSMHECPAPKKLPVGTKLIPLPLIKEKS